MLKLDHQLLRDSLDNKAADQQTDRQTHYQMDEGMIDKKKILL